jgi:tetratricopeptide (TPR) repeat protein
MARRVQIGLVAAAFLLLGAAPSALVRYSFDDDLIEAGPDTFAVFQAGKGSVTLSTLNRFSGYRSVEIRDVPGDRNFPELQGYFPLRTRGKLYLHFALMTTDSSEELNIALAGPQWFTLRKHGLSFWLKTSGGHLVAVSDSMPKKLFPIRQFIWYIVDAAYDIDAGTYDLTIHQEGLEPPVLAVRGQANAANQPGSHIDKFSFIGDHDTDESKVVYYVDDVLVGVDESIVQQPFVAPARRKLFFDYWNEAQRARSKRPAAIPLMRLEDLGIGPAESDSLRKDGGAEKLASILSGPIAANSGEFPFLQAITAWRRGVAALESGEAEAALAHFEHASQLTPSAALYQLDAVIALAHLDRWQEVDARLPAIAAIWRGDPRLPVALAQLGLARGDFASADATALTLEQQFLVLLWQGPPSRAESFAATQRDQAATPEDRTAWEERLGDAAFLAGDTARARRHYEASQAWLKLADVCYQLGDLESEREFRERVYGRLRR